MAAGRPSMFTDKLGIEICRRIAEGESLRSVCLDKKMPTRETVHVWIIDGKHKEFSDQYERSTNVRTENMFDDLQNISDLKDETESPMRSRLRIDTRKWYLSKIMPKKYGEKIDLTSGGEKIEGNTIIFKDFTKDAADTE